MVATLRSAVDLLLNFFGSAPINDAAHLLPKASKDECSVATTAHQCTMLVTKKFYTIIMCTNFFWICSNCGKIKTLQSGAPKFPFWCSSQTKNAA
jgi:hypothetical protein